MGNSAEPTCFAVMAQDEIRQISSSGGVFTLAAEWVIDQGGVVAGAMYEDDFSVKLGFVSKKEDLGKMRGSKYIQAKPGMIYRETKDYLEQGKLVLFTGLPCHVAALYGILGDKDYPNLFTMDLVCHGMTSQKVFDKYRHDILKNRRLTDLRFKAKEPWGWHAGINAAFEDGTTYQEPLEKDEYFRAYLKNISKNTACSVCHLNQFPRQADLSIGDFWGINKYNASFNDGLGTSEVFVNNPHGQELLDAIRPETKLCERVPGEVAKGGNGVLNAPYRLNRNRNYFFEHLATTDFGELVSMCETGNFIPFAERRRTDLPREKQGLYYLAKIVHDNVKGRKIALWGDAPVFRSVLRQIYNLDADLIVMKNPRSPSEKPFDILQGKASEYYLVCMAIGWNQADADLIAGYGFQEIKDYAYRIPKPIVLENYRLNGITYTDSYGNLIRGNGGKIKKVIFRGLGNEISIGDGVSGLENVTFDLAANCIARIGDRTLFHDETNVQLIGEQGTAMASLYIGKRCSFRDTLIRIYADIAESRILVNDACTFEETLCLHANQGKQIVIGEDCMFSRNIDVWAGDGHSMMDSVSEANVNSAYDLPTKRKQTVIGDHVWVGKKAFILTGADIGNGSIVGAGSVVKGTFPNNCVIAGDPAAIAKRDAAWSRNGRATDIAQCGQPFYVGCTGAGNNPIAGKNVLVIGGTRIMGTALVNRLLALGNHVTVANRGKSRDNFGDRVERIRLDITKADSVRNALSGRHYDVVFDNLAYSSNNVRNLLSAVGCDRYVQLSSIETYYPAKGWIHETKYDPFHFPMKWYGDEGENGHYDYTYGKRLAEAAVYQNFSDLSAVTVRIPYVIPTDRIDYYCKHVVTGTPMKISDVRRGLCFVRGSEVGRFLPWIAAQKFTGPINLSSTGFVTIEAILNRIEEKTGKTAIIDSENGEPAPFNVFKEDTFCMDLSKSQTMGWIASDIDDWFWQMLDDYIDRAKRANA